MDISRQEGSTVGGSQPGRAGKVTPELRALVHQLNAEGRPKSYIARKTGLSRPTVYKLLHLSYGGRRPPGAGPGQAAAEVAPRREGEQEGEGMG